MNITILIIQISFLEEGIQQSNSPKICLRSGCLRIVTKHLNHPIHHLCTKHFLNSMLLDWETKWHSILIQELLMIEVIMPIIGNVPSKLRIVDIISQGILNILLYYISIVINELQYLIPVTGGLCSWKRACYESTINAVDPGCCTGTWSCDGRI